MPRHALALTILWPFFLAGAGCRPVPQPAKGPAEAQQAIDQLLELMQQRLELMHEVARWKWNTGKAIADPERERAFLKEIVKEGAAHQLDPDWTRAFFAAQIEAAKRLQQADFKRWQAANQGPFAQVADLAQTLRPRIDVLSRDLVRALAKARPFLQDDEIRRSIPARARDILRDAEVRTLALEPLTTK